MTESGVPDQTKLEKLEADVKKLEDGLRLILRHAQTGDCAEAVRLMQRTATDVLYYS